MTKLKTLKSFVQVGPNEKLIKTGQWSDQLKGTIWERIKKNKKGLPIRNNQGSEIPTFNECKIHVSQKVKAFDRAIKNGHLKVGK